jgi:hypothetical protein
MKYLSFEARIPPSEARRGQLKEVFLAIRVINGWGQHWAYGSQVKYNLLRLKEAEFTPFYVDLGDKKKWWWFNSDGNRYYAPTEPQFDIIGPVVIEMGGKDPATSMSGDRLKGRPSIGHGVVDLRNFRLTTVKPR